MACRYCSRGISAFFNDNFRRCNRRFCSGWKICILWQPGMIFILIYWCKIYKNINKVSIYIFINYEEYNKTSTYNPEICAVTIYGLTDADKETLESVQNPNNTDGIMEPMTRNVYWFIGIGLVTWLCGWIQTFCLMSSALR